MKLYVTDAAGVDWQLPDPIRWEGEYGAGTPCDAFFARCPWDMGLDARTREWAAFYAVEKGERVFTGVVDECEMVLDGSGCCLELSGRGMAALLLDNEAAGRDYQLATWEDIRGEHISPYGIEVVGGEGLRPVERFRVDTGSSEWTVLTEYLARCGGDLRPRFDGAGRLVLTSWEEGERLVMGEGFPLTEVRRREERCGLVSEILVRERYTGAVRRVEDEQIAALGVRARRIVTMPGHAAAAAMEQRGREVLAAENEGWEELVVTVPAPFAAMPGQLVELERQGWGINGLYRVARCETGLDREGHWSRLTMRKEE